MTERPIPSAQHRSQTLEHLHDLVPEKAVHHVELGIKLWSVASSVVRTFEAHFRRHELSASRFAVLLSLLAAPHHRLVPSELSRKLNVRRPTVTGVVDGLVQLGLVRRSADAKNRRNQPVELTAKGKQVITAAARGHFAQLGAAAKALNASERADLHRALSLMSRLEQGIAP